MLAGQLLIRNCEGDAERRRWKLPVSDAVRNYFDSEALGIADRFCLGLAIAHNARKLDRFGDPAPILLATQINREFHVFSS